MRLRGREKMKWSDIGVRARIISGGVIGLVAAMTVGTAGCSERDESAGENLQTNTFAEQFFEVREFEVRLKPKNDGTLWVSVDKGRRCEQNPHLGCMRFLPGIEGKIRFYISGTNNQVKSCPEARYVITKVELTATGEVDATKGVFKKSVDGLPDWLKGQAFKNLDLETGIVKGDSGGEPGTQLILTNLNRHKAKDETLQFWYKVTVTDCENPAKEWVTDPRGDNEG
jgi:hypothetical protein